MDTPSSNSNDLTTTNDVTSRDTPPSEPEYDSRGALLYVVAVIFIYGFSIIFMIGTTVKKNKENQDDLEEAHRIVQEMTSSHRLSKKQAKFKTQLMMQGRKINHIVGANRAFVDVPHVTDTFLSTRRASEPLEGVSALVKASSDWSLYSYIDVIEHENANHDLHLLSPKDNEIDNVSLRTYSVPEIRIQLDDDP